MQLFYFCLGFFGLQFAWQMRLALSGPVTEGLGADPNDLAAALCDELLPPPFRFSGRLSDDLTQLVWDKGGSCAVVTDNGMLRFTLPGRGEAYLRPVETP